MGVDDLVRWVLGGFGALAMGVVSVLWGRLSSVEKIVHEHKLHVADTYVKATAFDKAIDRVINKLEEISAKLDLKADKAACSEMHRK